MNTNVWKKPLAALFFVGSLLGASCSNDEPNDAPFPEPKAQVSIDAPTGTAQIAVSSTPAGATVQLVYDTPRGQVAAKGTADAQGTCRLSIEQLAGYEQNLKLVVTQGETSKRLVLDKIPAKAEMLTEAQIATGLKKHTWKSVAKGSRVLITNSSIRPYSLLATVAQKYFTFADGGKFTFEVTSPQQFKHETGTWTLSAKRLDIHTAIPLGAIQLKNVRIQSLSDTQLALLAEIEDGLFLLRFEAQ